MHHFFRMLNVSVLAVLLCGFQIFALHWPGDIHSIVLRLLPEGMSEGMPERIRDAAGMWTSDTVRFSLLDAGHPAQDMGTIHLGSTEGQGHMGTRFFARGHALLRCEIIIADDAWHRARWHLGTDPPPPDRYDVWTQVAHELGHCLGLQHENTATPPALMRPLIHMGEMQRTLTQDDVRGRDALFPPGRKRSSGCSLRL